MKTPFKAPLEMAFEADGKTQIESALNNAILLQPPRPRDKIDPPKNKKIPHHGRTPKIRK